MKDKKLIFVLMLALFFAMRWPAMCPAETAGEVRGKALAVLKSDASVEQKLAACEELARVGDKDCVPVLTGMLGDDKLSHMARYALEPIPDKSVDDAFRAAAAKLSGKLLSGVISSIGARRDSAAVELLGRHLADSDADVARTAAIALGRIGTVDTGKALLDALRNAKEDSLPRICDGLLACGARLAAQGRGTEAKTIYDGMLAQNLPARIQAAALRGTVLCDSSGGTKQLGSMLRDSDFCVFAMALRVAAETKDRKITEVLVSGIGTLPAERTILVVKTLGQRGDRAAVPLLLSMANSGEKELRLEAIQSLAEVGDTSAMPMLVELMKGKDDPIARAAAAAMAGLPGPEVDAAIVKILEGRDPALRLRMIEMAGLRRIGSAVPALLRAMSDADISIRTASARSYGELAGEGGIPVLIEMLLKSTDPRDIGLYERTLASVCPAASDKDACTRRLADALSKAAPAAKPALLRTLRVTGGPNALKAVRGAVDDPSKEIRATAVRVLTEWTTADAAPVLLELAKTVREPTERTLSLRGYLGIALQGNVALQDKVAICRQAAPLVQREEEKRMLLGAVAAASNAGLLDLIGPYLDDSSVKGEAVATVMAIAEKRKKNEHVGAARAALEKVVKTADDPAVVKRAEALLKQMANEK